MNIHKKYSLCVMAISLLIAISMKPVLAQNCQTDNIYLRAMPESVITVVNTEGETVEFNVKTALNNQTRSAGFQQVCASTIAEKPILFVFQSPLVPKFHMRNVVAPLDIAFIDEEGQIESIQQMLPYVVGSIIRPLYSSRRSVIAALEVEQGFYKKNNIEVGLVISWALLDKN